MYNIISPINSLGYGIAGLNICKSLNQIDPVALFTLGQPSVTNSSDHQQISDMISNAKVPNFSAPCIRIWHQHDMSQFVGNGIKVGFPIFELDNFTENEKHHLNFPDKIFVCSEWAKDVITQATGRDDDEIHVVPLGVDRSIFRPVEPNAGETYTFFNCGKWEVRKGHDIIVEAFNKAFNSSDKVQLKMMCENPFNSEEEEKNWIDLYKNSKLGSKISIIPRVATHEEVYNIMATVDCGVFPARAEGWNLELLEMMSCNKPVIATDYSAHTEFCTDDNSFLINPSEVEPAFDGKWFDGNTGRWAKIEDKDVDQLSEYMRHVYKKDLRENSNGVNTAKEYSWQKSASIVQEVLGA